jgi:hypothetical protein
MTPPFLTLPLHGSKWSLRHSRFTSGAKVQDARRIEGWADCRACLDTVQRRQIPRSCWESNHGHPTSSPSQCLLSYPVTSLTLGTGLTLDTQSHSLHRTQDLYSIPFVRVPPDVISLKLCTPKVVGVAFKLYTV